MIRIIPVLDIKAGQVVRGIAGRRSEYRPIVSKLTTSSVPLDVARAFRERFGFTELYLADLDAIGGASPALPLYGELHGNDFRLWVDAGVRNREEAEPLAKAGVARIVVGLETVQGPAVLADLCRKFGRDRIVFSLDLKGAMPLGDTSRWKTPDPMGIAHEAIAQGVRRLIVLDLAQVGTGSGTGTEELCRRLGEMSPDAELVAGGGVRDEKDLARLEQCGVNAVLVASALHDGRLQITSRS